MGATGENGFANFRVIVLTVEVCGCAVATCALAPAVTLTRVVALKSPALTAAMSRRFTLAIRPPPHSRRDLRRARRLGEGSAPVNDVSRFLARATHSLGGFLLSERSGAICLRVKRGES